MYQQSLSLKNIPLLNLYKKELRKILATKVKDFHLIENTITQFQKINHPALTIQIITNF